MHISVNKKKEWTDNNLPLTPHEMETAACEAVAECVEFFESNYIRVGPGGLYMKVGPNVHLFSIDISYVHTLKPGEDVPVQF